MECILHTHEDRVIRISLLSMLRDARYIQADRSDYRLMNHFIVQARAGIRPAERIQGEAERGL